jgi:signal transduction histidine kinase
VRTDLALLARETWQGVPHPPGDHRLEVAPARFLSPVDPDRFRQVFINIFRNAMEAMPQGGTVRVTLTHRGRWVRCEVKDQGTGIKARDRSKLFRPFFTTKAKGTGLGLAMVRSILQAHGGKISVQPNRPRGVRMVLEWPQPQQRG